MPHLEDIQADQTESESYKEFQRTQPLDSEPARHARGDQDDFDGCDSANEEEFLTKNERLETEYHDTPRLKGKP